MVVRRMAGQLLTLADTHPDLLKRIEAHCQEAYELVTELEKLQGRYLNGSIVAPDVVRDVTSGMLAEIATALLTAPQTVPQAYNKAAFVLAYHEAHGVPQRLGVVRKSSD